MRSTCQRDSKNSCSVFFCEGCITVHSWRSCPSFPQPKQNFGSFSYLKGIQYLFPLSLKTNIPLRRGFLYV
ncbi:hypothetical protein ERO13_D05G279701v2 [Gossypium hirsutum]|uniref:Uncharacterized protein n=2 Tax=Gossypium TaxID=3633 RepID=A0A5J5RIC8_GOSBA|nr:hypothetical protein ES319_D05G294000v1 [Gossypium barbadense]KAB2031285.1 hypothetical protein ES319_D05G294000v1 [Gossypium barbadense]KAG4148328.1 hypothetical protein ERO13_D05G279701v2 [Gossypium hirsutum]TYG70391.1 hypothetical protein ES288_D05G309600v1 [Gossypium darwinii]TYG70392.1 hypothetical protein ES288_D05G309600v1 [Gossypium darwinii]